MPRLYDIEPLQPLIAAGYTLLTPNQRLARRIFSEWEKAAEGADGEAAIAQVSAVEPWLEHYWQRAVAAGQLPARRLLSPAQAHELWRQVIAADQARTGHYDLLQPGAAARLAARARDTLMRWEVDLASPPIRQLFLLDEDCGAFLRWADAFSARLARDGLSTLVDAMRGLATLTPQAPRIPIALLAFDTLPPLYEHCLHRLGRDVQTVETDAVAAEHCAVLRCEDSRGELAWVARWAAELAAKEPDLRLGIVVADSDGQRATLDYLLRREFDCLDRRYQSLPVNFSAGQPLADAPLVRDALQLLALPAEGIGPQTLALLLQSRFIKPGLASGGATVLLTRCFETRLERLTLTQLQRELETAPGECSALAQALQLSAGSALIGGRHRPSVWIQRFERLLAPWSWPGTALDSLEYQQLEQWQRLLREYAEFDLVMPPLHFAEALQLLRRLAGEAGFQPQTEDSSVQVLGPLEAAGLQFDKLWLCGMQASQWPAPARPHPFIPLQLQRERGMPHASAEREWIFSEALVNRYRRATGVLYASFAAQRDGIPELPSPLLRDFTPMPDPPPTPLKSSWLHSLANTRQGPDQNTPAPPVAAAEAGLLRGGSAIIEDQSLCPFRAYARRRLQLRALPEPEPGLSAADRGELLHSALFHLWGELGDQAALAQLSPAAEQECLQRAVAGAVAALPPPRRRAAGPACLRLEGVRLQRLLAEWLQLERRRPAFRVLAREAPASLELGGLALSLRIDRIDALEDGSTLLIDYKSGLSAVADWFGERPEKPQLPLYALAAEASLAGVAFATVRERRCQFAGLARVDAGPGIHTDIARGTRGQRPCADWEAVVAYWRQSLTVLAAAFIGGEAAVEPKSPASCRHCGMQALCRIELAAS